MGKIEIIVKPSFAVAGIEGRGEANETLEWIPPLWETPRKRRAEIACLIIGGGGGVHDLSLATSLKFVAISAFKRASNRGGIV